jgi:hypothetical protein
MQIKSTVEREISPSAQIEKETLDQIDEETRNRVAREVMARVNTGLSTGQAERQTPSTMNFMMWNKIREGCVEFSESEPNSDAN